MSKKDHTKKRILFWGLMVVSFVLIGFGWWRFNLANFEPFLEAKPVAQDNYLELMEGMNDVGQEVGNELDVAKEIIVEDFEEAVEQKEQEQAKDAIIEYIIEDIENNYAQEESAQETGGEEASAEEEGAGEEVAE
jgi:hypothetical protein